MSASIHHFARTSGALEPFSTCTTCFLFPLGVLVAAIGCERSPDIVSEAQPTDENAETDRAAEAPSSIRPVEAEVRSDQPDVDEPSLAEEQPSTEKNGDTSANPVSKPSTVAPSKPASKKKPRYCAFPSDEGCIPRGSNVPLTVDQ